MGVWDWFRASPARAYTAVAVLLVAMFTTTTTLARYFHEEQQTRSETHFARGTSLVGAGDRDRGIVELRAALSLDRGNAAYALVLATALRSPRAQSLIRIFVLGCPGGETCAGAGRPDLHS